MHASGAAPSATGTASTVLPTAAVDDATAHASAQPRHIGSAAASVVAACAGQRDTICRRRSRGRDRRQAGNQRQGNQQNKQSFQQNQYPDYGYLVKTHYSPAGSAPRHYCPLRSMRVTVNRPFNNSTRKLTRSPAFTLSSSSGLFTSKAIVIGGMSISVSGPWRMMISPAGLSTFRTIPSFGANADGGSSMF